MIEFSCPSCDKSIRVNDKHAGKRGKCPKCGNALVVPGQSARIVFSCESCGHRIKVADRYAGKKGKCPKCKHAVVVPQQSPTKKEDAVPGIICSICKHAVASADASTEEPVECPGCGSLIDASSGSPVTEAPEPSDTDEAYDEGPATAQTSTGLNRRLVIILASAALVVVVGMIGLLVFFRPWDAGPGVGPRSSRAPQETAAPASRLQAAANDTPPVEQEVTPDISDANRLQFGPSPGDKRSLRVSMTTQYTMSVQQGGPAQELTGVQSITVDLEAGEASAYGTVAVRVTLARIQVKEDAQGITQSEYDSAQAPAEDNPVKEIYAPFVGKHFTIGVSARGEITNPGLEELFLGAAQDCAQAEDDMTRASYKEKADRVIERTDQGFGSRQGRILALKRQLEASPILGKGEIRSLLGHLVAPLPVQAVQSGTSWRAPIAVRGGTHMEMPATYTVTALDEDACTIEARGDRGVDEEPFVYQTGQVTVSNKLAGSSRVKLMVDRHTGWLRHKEQKTSLSGQIKQSQAGAQGTETAIETTMEITTTVAAVE
jgi:DNA-directed RNA polymerase subunit M/transcription elongation factor TFIIS